VKIGVKKDAIRWTISKDGASVCKTLGVGPGIEHEPQSITAQPATQ
jgi:hypothetical protein